MEEAVVQLLASAAQTLIPDPISDPKGFLQELEEEDSATEYPGLTLEEIQSAIDERRR